ARVHPLDGSHRSRVAPPLPAPASPTRSWVRVRRRGGGSGGGSSLAGLESEDGGFYRSYYR
ncbi:unnamed protein product, partial [Urochloa humidicola]